MLGYNRKDTFFIEKGGSDRRVRVKENFCYAFVFMNITHRLEHAIKS